ncbi:hypothetical protein [Nitrosospira sp. NpAV]|uniref:hypothetical protein n=1 Tax=Nitrosospira sp. NpAV TaxID=58133 RepID=UPI0005A2478E|nr:hypothetical protein [Nitrosospira sp. NpAV]KIO49582.1 hypothetical protein SQ11_05475 [Nitrosospira sp. NpAV]
MIILIVPRILINEELFKLKRIALLAIALSILSGCAGTGSIRETLVTSERGVKTYLLAKDVGSLLGEAYTVKGLNERSKELCPNGYTVMNEETHEVKNWTGNPVGREEVTRKIMCYSSE